MLAIVVAYFRLNKVHKRVHKQILELQAKYTGKSHQKYCQRERERT